MIRLMFHERHDEPKYITRCDKSAKQSGICKVRKFLLNLGTKCSNSAFNAQGSRVLIIVVQLRGVTIYVAAVKALRKKRKDRMKLSLGPLCDYGYLLGCYEPAPTLVPTALE
jgi:hypothetical protein